MGSKSAEIAVYPLSLLSQKNKSFWLISLDRILERYPFLEIPHKQSFYMLLFVINAEGTVNIDSQRIRLEGNKLIWVNPGRVFSIDIDRKAKGYALGFTENFFNMRYNNNVLYQFSYIRKNLEPYVRFSEKQTRRWNMLFKLMQEETAVKDNQGENVLRSYLNILLHDLENKFYKPLSYNKPANAREIKIIEFEKLLESEFSAQHSPSFYANRLAISANYLNKLCREQRGQRAGELIRARISIEAQRLLHHTHFSVSEIAYQLGFETPSYFITFFKKSSGTTPEQFRKSKH